MRYLYGDLTEFPQHDNVLDQLKRFIDMAVPALRLDHEIGAQQDQISRERTLLTETLVKMERFHKAVGSAIEQARAEQEGDQLVAQLADGSTAGLDRFVEDSKQRVHEAVRTHIRANEARIDALQQEILVHLKAFFVDSGLPLAGNAMRVDLRDDGYRALSEILDVVGTRCVYRLATTSSEFFNEPRKFADLSSERLDLPIGLRKVWLKKDPKVETMRIDDAAVSEVIDSEEWLELRLARKRGNGTEGVRVRLGKRNPEQIKVYRIEPDGAEKTVADELLHPGHRDQLALARNQLRPHVLALYRNRGDLTAIRIEDEDVIRKRRLPELVERFVRFLTPTIREIAARSPAKTELCLKVEHEEDRREEIFVQKISLLNQLITVPIGQRTLFAPLELHRGVPGFAKVFEEDRPETLPLPEEVTAPD